MTANEGRKLKVGDRVKFLPDNCEGTVRETSYAAIKIEWDDNKWALMQFEGNAPWENIEKIGRVLWERPA